MALKSHLHEFHSKYGKLTDFGGFEMPLWYSSIIDEHSAVRNAAGLFDVSHMGRVSISGEEATQFLDYLLPSLVKGVENGRAFYSMICREDGGILDDVITNKLSSTEYVMVLNAANREKDLRWIYDKASKFRVSIDDRSSSTALIAFQGPLARQLLQKSTDIELSSLKRFRVADCRVAGETCLISRTGYTGEDGFEIMVYDTLVESPTRALNVWNSLLDLGRSSGVLPCGLGARDSLRLEAGMCLYGQDIDETTTPIEASLGSVVELQRKGSFIGRDAIETQVRSGVGRKRVAFSIVESGIPRHGFDVVYAGSPVGKVTSGSFSPTMRRGIGMAYVPTPLAELGTKVWIRIRDADKQAEIVSTPFYDSTRYGYRRKIPA